MNRSRTLAVVVSVLAVSTAGCASDRSVSTTKPTSPVPQSAPSSAPASSSTASTDTSEPDRTAPGAPPTSSTRASSDVTIDGRVDKAADALAAGDFTTMLDLLKLSGLADKIEGRQVTILAPTEAAFRSLTADEIADLLTNPTKVEKLVSRHVLDELLTYEQLAARTEVTNLAGESLVVAAKAGSVTVGGAVVSAASGAPSGKGGQEVAVLAIDRVLLGG